ncbi:hypothetical protein JW964_08380 [candidate division KSB1 bacterium]|nr:hypothetical protein [candidate division KSB1 bacterium]
MLKRLIQAIILALFVISLFMNSPIQAKSHILLTNLFYWPGSEINEKSEFQIRNRLYQVLLDSSEAFFRIQVDTTLVRNYPLEKTNLRSNAKLHNCDYLVSGQIDLIGENNWIIAFDILCVFNPSLDTLINVDVEHFNLQGKLTAVLESGAIQSMGLQMLDFIERHPPKKVWWKSPKYLIPGVTIGASLTLIILYEWNPFKKKTPEEKDLPGPPQPPGSGKF